MVKDVSQSNFLQNHALRKSQKVDDKYIPEPFTKAAKGMEQMFARLMLEQMNKTSSPVTPDSPASRFYKSLEVDQRSQAMSNQGKGLGVQQMILDQIYPKEQRTKRNYDIFQHQQNNVMPLKQAIKKYQEKNEEIQISNRENGFTKGQSRSETAAGIRTYQQEAQDE